MGGLQNVLLMIHLLLALAMIGVVLLQRSEGGALGIGGGGGGGLMSSRAAASALTRVTTVLAACFFVTSMGLTWLSNQSSAPTSVLDSAPATEESAPLAPLEPLSQ
jgi:preprotein translocase subunit SecG